MEYLIYVAVLACAVLTVSGLDCHQCQTMADQMCSDPYYSDHSGGCDDDQYCVKYKTIVRLKDSGTMDGRERVSSVVTRSCEAKEGKEEGCMGWQNNGGVTIKCWCSGDNCNSGAWLLPSKSSLFATCIFSVMVLLLRWRN